jgi:hypothetical protein
VILLNLTLSHWHSSYWLLLALKGLAICRHDATATATTPNAEIGEDLTFTIFERRMMVMIGDVM